MQETLAFGIFHKDATSFNHDLCAWRDKFPHANANDTFMGSGCTFQDTPRLHQRGPFCATSCMTQSNTNANANSSPAVSYCLHAFMYVHDQSRFLNIFLISLQSNKTLGSTPSSVSSRSIHFATLLFCLGYFVFIRLKRSPD